MRLLKTSSPDSPSGLEIVDVNPSDIPQYAILSHTWEDQEVIYTDMLDNTAFQKKGYEKIRYTCIQAVADGLEYCWIDTCCIDKRSSAELSEAINSMYEWYQKAETCYAYLPNCPGDVDPYDLDSEFANSRWFTRGWTLQELVAPLDLSFFGKDWVKIGEKTTLSKPLSVITGIDQDILTGELPLQSASVAKRMSWAANRQTTRPEDLAYCLMGIFDVNMPMLYGEGDKAFLRLQEEIMKHSDDESLFCWLDDSTAPDSYHGLLARSPRYFAYSSLIVPYQDWERKEPYSMSNQGLHINLRLKRLGKDGLYIAPLDCPAPPDYQDDSFVAIFLQKLSDGYNEQYARVNVGEFTKTLDRSDNPCSIYVRQDVGSRDVNQGVWPKHVFQLRKGPDKSMFPVRNVAISPQCFPNTCKPIKSASDAGRAWYPSTWPLAYKINNKGSDQLALGIFFTRSDGGLILVMIGSAGGAKVGFDAIELPTPSHADGKSGSSNTKTPSFAELKPTFVPTISGQSVELVHHRVRVDAQPKVHKSAKYYFIDILIQPLVQPLPAVEFVEGPSQTTSASGNADQRLGLKEKKKSTTWRRFISS
ncbi:hypothetical protein ACJ41O_001521 [Fusarium nematophilum]